jgi:hypothetical protein
LHVYIRRLAASIGKRLAPDTDQRNRASFDRQNRATAAIHGPDHGTGAHDVRSRITIFFVERALIRDVA